MGTALMLLAGGTSALLLFIWFGRKAPPASAAPAAFAAPLAPLAAGPLALLVASAIRVRNGDSAAQLAAAFATNSARCDLDPELVDEEGYPVTSGRADTLDEAVLEEAMAPWLKAQGLEAVRFAREQLRALALASLVVRDLVPVAAGQNVLAADAALPVLQLQPMLAGLWNADQRDAARRWLRHLVEQQGWPAQGVVLSDAPPSLVAALACGTAPLCKLLVACGSSIGQDSVNDWIGQRMLYTARNPRGHIPGEGAAGLLLADPAQAALLDGSSLVRLTARQGIRDSAVDGPGPHDHSLLATLIRDAAQEHSVRCVAADTDLHPQRTAELLGAVGEALPQLDHERQLIPVGALCGETGAVGSLVALALAQEAAVRLGDGALCVSNLDGLQRSVLFTQR